MFFSPFSIAITALGEERANISAFCTFVRFVLVRICRFPLPLGVWKGLRFVIVALPRLFSYLLFTIERSMAVGLVLVVLSVALWLRDFYYGLCCFCFVFGLWLVVMFVVCLCFGFRSLLSPFRCLLDYMCFTVMCHSRTCICNLSSLSKNGIRNIQVL